MKQIPIYFRRGTPEGGSATQPPKNRFLSMTRPRRSSKATIATMSSTFVAGIMFAVAHHVYYSKLNDQIVGSSARQQWSIGIGTAFAFLVQICFANTAGTACVQWVWRRCGQQVLSISAIDAAFAVDRNMFMLLDLRFVSKFPVAAGLALIFWCFPLSSLITPATLSVEPKPNSTVSVMLVDRPTFNNFADVDNRANHYHDSIKLSSRVNTIAITGEQPHLTSANNLPNATYSVETNMPLVRCNNSDDRVQNLTATAAYRKYRKYFGPFISGGRTIEEVFKSSDTIFHPGNLTITSRSESIMGGIRYFAASSKDLLMSIEETSRDFISPLSEMWIAIGSPQKWGERLESSKSDSASYYRCVIRNASITTDVVFTGNAQLLHTSDIKVMDFIDQREKLGDVVTAMADLFTSLQFKLLEGFAIDLETPGSERAFWNTTVDETIFGTAKDFSIIIDFLNNEFFAMNVTAQDKNFTTLIEEFSFNASWILIGLPAYTEKVSTEVTQTLWVNKYTYHPQNLFIAYGCSIFACLITTLAGIYAIYANGESYNNHFSTISSAMQSPGVAALFASRPASARDLQQKIAKTKIQLHKARGVERFRTENDYVALDVV